MDAKLCLEDVVEMLKHGAIGVIPTDTTYGMVAEALKPTSVERMYDIRKRPSEKPFIILMHHLMQLKQFGIQLTEKQQIFLSEMWPGPVSVVLPCTDKAFTYLTRGTDTLAFRIPDNGELQKLVRSVGPLIAPSANIAGEPVAQTVAEARAMFGDQVDFFIDGGELHNPPSTLLAFEDSEINVLREGAIASSFLRSSYDKIGP